MSFYEFILIYEFIQWSLFVVDLQSVQYKLATLLKRTPEYIKLLQMVIFRNMFICIKELNYIEDLTL